MTTVASAGAYLLSTPVELAPNATGEQRPTHEDMEWGGKRVGWGVRSSGLFGKE
jgi:hypothetical protein